MNVMNLESQPLMGVFSRPRNQPGDLLHRLNFGALLVHPEVSYNVILCTTMSQEGGVVYRARYRQPRSKARHAATRKHTVVELCRPEREGRALTAMLQERFPNAVAGQPAAAGAQCSCANGLPPQRRR